VRYYRKYQLVKHLSSKHPGLKISIDSIEGEENDHEMSMDEVMPPAKIEAGLKTPKGGKRNKKQRSKILARKAAKSGKNL
jgi:hypothetical protein